ncbi:MAG: hypothetical protein C5B49_12620 [Bdellovibrio sp.]|nr:MAG: hypothetical protein C5B49_12620 [Bdellovibrio sp.]
MKKVFLTLFLVLICGILLWSILPEPWRRQIVLLSGVSSFWGNELALASFKNNDYSLAQSRWSEASAEDPQNFPLIFNLGLGYQALGHGEDAKKSYQVIFNHPRAPAFLAFGGHFNQGVLHQSEKDVDQALRQYQAALDIQPDSKETKINIELMMQQQKQDQKGQSGKDGKNSQDNKDPSKDQKEGDDKDQDKKKDQPKKYADQPKPQPRPFKSEQLDQKDVNKILAEIRQQEQKIRGEYNRREVKEQPRDKDW